MLETPNVTINVWTNANQIKLSCEEYPTWNGVNSSFKSAFYEMAIRAQRDLQDPVGFSLLNSPPFGEVNLGLLPSNLKIRIIWSRTSYNYEIELEEFPKIEILATMDNLVQVLYNIVEHLSFKLNSDTTSKINLFATDEIITSLFLFSGSDSEKRNELIRKYGKNGDRLVEISLYLSNSTRNPPQLPTPPRYFISYRHESEEHKRWVHKFSEGLKKRGFTVTLDQWESNQEVVNVSRIVGEIGRCHGVIFIVTPELINSISFNNKNPRWVSYEYHVALFLMWHQSINVIGVVRSESKLAQEAIPGELINFENDATFESQMNENFFYNGLVIAPNAPEQGIWQKGWRLLAMSRYSQGENWFQEAVNKYPNIVYFWSRLAYSKIQQGKMIAAERDLEKAFELNKNDPLTVGLMAERAYENRDFEKAYSLISSIRNHNQYDPRINFITGNILDEQGKFEEAIKQYKLFIRKRPLNPNGFNNYGFALLNLKRYKKALQMFERAIDLNDSFLLARLNKANVLRLMGRKNESGNECKKILKISPQYSEAIRLLEYLNRN